MPFLSPVVLRGDLVELTPMTTEDVPALVDAASDGELWGLTYTIVPRPEDMAGWVQGLLREQEQGTRLPFTVRRRADGAVIGSTTFLHADPVNRRVEIGSTWNAASAQRSGTNTESKLLLLGHAFDTLGCIAVEFRTHWLNRQSRAAIERLGARLDGVLRSHQVMPDGTLRDTVVYSVLPHEWPAIRVLLQRRLAVGAASAAATGAARPAPAAG